MLSVSQEWQEASINQFRYPAYLECTVSVTPPGLREGATASANNTDPISDINAVIDGELTATKYATLEPDRWKLGDAFKILPDSGTVDSWWSNLTYPVTLTFEFDAVYSVPGVYAVWDYVEDSHPSSVVVTGYDQNGVATVTDTFSNLSSNAGFMNIELQNVKKVTLQIKGWNHESWRARAVEVMFGLYVSFNNTTEGRLSSATLTDRTNPIASELPQHTLDVTFKNYDQYFDPTLQQGVAPYLAQRQIIKATWSFEETPGVVETAPSMLYLVDAFDIPKSTSDVTMKCVSQLDFLTDTFTKGTYTGLARTLKDIALYVLQNVPLVKATDTETPWILPSALDACTTTAPIPALAANQILQYVASASGLRLGIDATTGYISYKSAPSTASSNCPLDKSTVYGEPQVKVSSRLKSIDVSIHTYVAKTVSEKIADASYTLTAAKTVVVKYNKTYATEVSFTATNAVISKANYYASYAELTLVPSASGASVSVQGTGKELVDEISYLRTYEDSEATNGLALTINNPLVTSTELAHTASSNALAYYSKRTEYTVDYMGLVQLEGTDVVTLTSEYGETPVEVSSNVVDFNGGWSGTVVCR